MRLTIPNFAWIIKAFLFFLIQFRIHLLHLVLTFTPEAFCFNFLRTKLCKPLEQMLVCTRKSYSKVGRKTCFPSDVIYRNWLNRIDFRINDTNIFNGLENTNNKSIIMTAFYLYRWNLALLILSWPHDAFNPRKIPEDSGVKVETIFGTTSQGALGCESKQPVHTVRLIKAHLKRTSRVPLKQKNTSHIICNLHLYIKIGWCVSVLVLNH